MSRRCALAKCGPLLGAALLATGVEATETASPDTVLEPIGAWSLSARDGGCALRRDFADGERAATLAMRRIMPNQQIEFAVIGSGIDSTVPTIEAGFVPEPGTGMHDWFAPASIGEREGVVFVSKADGIGAERFELRGASAEPIRLATGDAAAALKALDACVERELERLGVDMEARTSLQSGPVPVDAAKWAARLQEAYPREAVLNLRTGPVSMRLIIDQNGRATACHTMDRLTARVLRETACALMIEHSRFRPAIDANGEPVTSIVLQRVHYEISTQHSVDAHGLRQRDD